MIKKVSLIYSIFSMMAIGAILGYVIALGINITLNQMLYCGMISIAIMVPNGVIKRRNYNELYQLKDVYANHCDPLEFADQYAHYTKHCFVSKGEKEMNKIFLARMYNAGGQTEQAKKGLLELKDHYNSLSYYQQFWYCVGWIDIFTEEELSGRAAVLIEELGHIMNKCDYNVGLALDSDYKNALMTYYVNNGINLDIAKDTLQSLIKKGMSVAGLIQTYYLLGIIALKQNEKDLAAQYFNNVILKGNRLSIVNKAKELITQCQ